MSDSNGNNEVGSHEHNVLIYEVATFGNVASTLSVLEMDEFFRAVPCLIRGKKQLLPKRYMEAIHRFNEATIQNSAVVAFPKNENDVAKCIKFARAEGLEIAIAAGRHSYHGASSTEGLVIDLSSMDSLSHDAHKQTITVGGGIKARKVERFLSQLGPYAPVLGACNDTGVAGISLGGGTGFLTGQYGLVCDQLLAARVVLADDRIMACSDTINTDLFWAIRGGGSNFGIVTEMTLKYHKLASGGAVFFGPLIFSPQKVKPLLQMVGEIQDMVDKAEGKLCLLLAFTKAPYSDSIFPITLIFYDGSEYEARRTIEPLYRVGPVADESSMQLYYKTTEPNELVNGPATHQRYASSSAALGPHHDPEILSQLFTKFEEFMNKHGSAVGPSKIGIDFAFKAKVASIPIDAMAFAAREPSAIVVFEAQYDESLNDGEIRAEVKEIMDSVRQKVREKHLGPEHGVVENANFASGMEKAEEMFGLNLPRLRELKRRYDPDSVFRKWHYIAPAKEGAGGWTKP